MTFNLNKYTLFLFLLITSSNVILAESSILPPDLSSEIAIVVISTIGGEEIPDEPKIEAHMGIVYNGVGQINTTADDFNIYDGQIGIEIRGASSQGFPKKGYGFKTINTDGTDNNVELLGMPEEHDWVFHGPFTDKSLMRNAITYHLGRLTSDYAPNTRFCELIINNDYRGLYLITERLKRDKNRVDIANLKPEDLDGEELTGGYLFQIDRDDWNNPEDGWQSNSNTNNFYSFRSPSYKNIHSTQAQYIENYMHAFESDMSSLDFLSKYEDYVDIDSWINYFLVSEIGKHIDAYRLSFFMYKKKSTNGGKLHFGPLWDFNLGYGNFNYACSPDPEGWSYLFGSTCNDLQPYWVKRMTNIPDVADAIHCRWDTLRAGLLQTQEVLDYIDDNVRLISPSAQRNFDRWDILGNYVWPNDFVGNTYSEEITFLKSWITSRLIWMDENMLGNCSGEPSNIKDVTTSAKTFFAFPNPADQILFVERRNNFNTDAIIQIYNLMGAKLVERNLEKYATSISTAALPDGGYVYRILSKDRSHLSSDRFVVKH